MNELMICYGSNWLYFKTSQTAVDKAYQEYEETCENTGINLDNMHPTRVVLRDGNYADLGEINF